ncbi:MAG: response regulator transcription factor [Bifidobacteriaceae bacterium]|jgi:DNA-binding NarL/FixJ family response regulator|nr:response regulator transcription factor [Bifidobacteriaceae bacterium]
MIDVVIADDQELIRAGFRALLEAAGGIRVVAEASDGARAVGIVQSNPVDVVLMDIRMPNVDGLEATRLIRQDERLDGVRILILTTFESDDYVVEAVLAGANGFIGKNIGAEELADAVRTVAQEGSLLSSTAAGQLMTRFRAAHPRTPTASHALAALTAREHEVVTLLASGMSASEIADYLSLSPLTVKTHIGRAIAKSGARDRAGLVALALNPGHGQSPPGRGRCPRVADEC